MLDEMPSSEKPSFLTVSWRIVLVDVPAQLINFSLDDTSGGGGAARVVAGREFESCSNTVL